MSSPVESTNILAIFYTDFDHLLKQTCWNPLAEQLQVWTGLAAAGGNRARSLADTIVMSQ